MSEHLLRHYGKVRPVRASEPYALVPSRHTPMLRPVVTAAGEGLMVPLLTDEARALLEQWAAAQAPPAPAPPALVPPVREDE